MTARQLLTGMFIALLTLAHTSETRAAFDPNTSFVYIECYKNGVRVSRGSGVVVGADGRVLTAEHVIPSDAECKGALGGGETPRHNLTPIRPSSFYDAILLQFVRTPAGATPVGFVRLPARLNTQAQAAITAWGVPLNGTGEVESRRGHITGVVPRPGGIIPTVGGITTRGMSGGPVILESSGRLVGIIAGANFDPQLGVPTDYGFLAVQYIANELELPPAPTGEGAPTTSGSCVQAGQVWNQIGESGNPKLLVDFLVEYGAGCPVYSGAAVQAAEQAVYGEIIGPYAERVGIFGKYTYFYGLADNVKNVINALYAPTLCGFNHALSCLFLGAYNIGDWDVQSDDNDPLAGIETDNGVAASQVLASFKTACELGDGVGCSAAGVILNRSVDSSVRDYGDAIQYFSRGCEAGNYNGCTGAGMVWLLRMRNPNRAKPYLTSGCNSKDYFACIYLCREYSNEEWACRQVKETSDLLEQ